jgi:hypothetical protein
MDCAHDVSDRPRVVQRRDPDEDVHLTDGHQVVEQFVREQAVLGHV